MLLFILDSRIHLTGVFFNLNPVQKENNLKGWPEVGSIEN